MDAATEERQESEFVSSLNVTSAPSHSEFDARQVLTQALGRPSIKELERHTEKFGSSMVVQTAAEAGYGLDTLVRLQDFCDRHDQMMHRRDHPKARPLKFPSSEKRVKRMIDWTDEEAGEEEAA